MKFYKIFFTVTNILNLNIFFLKSELFYKIKINDKTKIYE